jgi:hypothetical protein
LVPDALEVSEAAAPVGVLVVLADVVEAEEVDEAFELELELELEDVVEAATPMVVRMEGVPDRPLAIHHQRLSTESSYRGKQ